MALNRDTLDLPLKETILDAGGSLTQPWAWFFRLVYERLNPLGVERQFALSGSYYPTTFASADVNTSTEAITETGHGYQTGALGRLTTDGTLPTGLSTNTDYYIIRVDANTYKLATSSANAIAGTAINITAVGSGNHTFTPLFEVTELKFDSRQVSQALVEFLIQRVTTSTGATELIEGGQLLAVYKPTSQAWNLSVVSNDKPDNSGVDFQITADGKVRYLLTSITGTPSISRFVYRVRVLAGKHSQYSSMASGR